MLLWLATQVHLKIPLEFIVHFLTQLKAQIMLWEMLGSVIQVDTNTADLLANHLFFFLIYIYPLPQVCAALWRGRKSAFSWSWSDRPWATWRGYSQWAACALDHWAIYHLIIFTENKQDLHWGHKVTYQAPGTRALLGSLRWAQYQVPSFRLLLPQFVLWDPLEIGRARKINFIR